MTIDIYVGHSLLLGDHLAVSADSYSHNAATTSSVGDFYSSAHYFLVPSVAGLNTVGASGFDFISTPVPEPSSSMVHGYRLAGSAAVARLPRKAERLSAEASAPGQPQWSRSTTLRCDGQAWRVAVRSLGASVTVLS